jgi:hypothetical protein
VSAAAASIAIFIFLGSLELTIAEDLAVGSGAFMARLGAPRHEQVFQL